MKKTQLSINYAQSSGNVRACVALTLTNDNPIMRLSSMEKRLIFPEKGEVSIRFFNPQLP